MFFQFMLKITLVSFFSLSLISCNDDTDTPPKNAAPQGIPVRVAAPQVKNLTEWNEFTGRFQAHQRVEIRARVSGYLDAIKFEDGQIVKKGDVLFIIDQRPFQIAVDQEQARFDAANSEYLRAKGLRKSKSISEELYQERLQVMRIAKASLDQARLNLEFTEIKAPISGRISNNRIDVGNAVNGNLASSATLLTTIVSTAPIEFYFEVTETELLNYLRARQRGEALSDRGKNYPVFLKLQDEDDFLHRGKINFADNEISEDTGTVLVRAIFDNREQLFEPGMFARLRLARGPASDKIIIPQHVIGTEQTRKYVYALDSENKAQRKYLKLGAIVEDNMQVVHSGLEREDRIVIGGLHMVRPGALITPIESNTQELHQEGAN